MDHNLIKIKQSNMHAITHGSIQTAVLQAEDYLKYIIESDPEGFKEELDAFVLDVKEIRRQNRGQMRREKRNKTYQNI